MVMRPERESSGWMRPEKNIEVVQLPANTTHFLQPCDLHVNKKISKGVKSRYDELKRICAVNMTAVRMKIIVGLGGLYNVSQDDIVRSFNECGLWPMNYRFTKKFEGDKNTEDNGGAMVSANGTDDVNRKSQRMTDQKTLSSFRRLGENDDNARAVIKDVYNLLHVNYVSYCIVDNCISPPKEATKTSGKIGSALCKGAPAQYLTFADLISCRKAEEERKVEEKAQKEREALSRKRKRDLKMAGKPGKRVGSCTPDGGKSASPAGKEAGRTLILLEKQAKEVCSNDADAGP